MKHVRSIFFIALTLTSSAGCSSISGMKQPSSFGKTLGYERCRIYGPLNTEKAYVIAKKWVIEVPDQGLDAILNEQSGGEVYFFDCVHFDTTNIPSGIIFYGLVKNNTVIKKAIELIEN